MRAVAIVLTLAAGVVGCGKDSEVRRADSVASAMRRQPTPPASEGVASDPVRLDSQLGVVDRGDVEARLESRFGDLRACYRHAGKAQRYAGGEVRMRFLLAGNGKAKDVLVVESDLGNYDVERCLVRVGRTIVFDPPEGGKATTFDYPIVFRPTGRMTVQDIDGLKINRNLTSLAPKLAACGPVGKGVAAIMYIQPNGSVGSVGLTSSGALNEDVGDCVVQKMRRWRVSTTLPGRVLRCNFRVPSVAAVGDHAARRAPLRIAARRRPR